MKPLLALLLCVLAAGLTQAQPSRFSREKYVEKGDTLNYRMLFPDADRQRKYPLVIFLHGSGERGSDNDAQLKWGVMNFATDQNMLAHPAIVIAPQCPEHQTWSSVTADKDRTKMTLNAEPSKPMHNRDNTSWILNRMVCRVCGFSLVCVLLKATSCRS